MQFLHVGNQAADAVGHTGQRQRPLHRQQCEHPTLPGLLVRSVHERSVHARYGEEYGSMVKLTHERPARWWVEHDMIVRVDRVLDGAADTGQPNNLCAARRGGVEHYVIPHQQRIGHRQRRDPTPQQRPLRRGLFDLPLLPTGSLRTDWYTDSRRFRGGIGPV